MTLKNTYACSECGAERRQANHWFVYRRSELGLDFHKWEWMARENMLEDQDLGHLCGQGCAHKVLDKFMAEQAAADRAPQEVAPEKE